MGRNTPEIKRMVELYQENLTLKEQLKNTKSKGDVSDLQDRIDENTISINAISVDIQVSIEEAISSLKIDKLVGGGDPSYKEQALNAYHLFDAIMNDAIHGAFRFALAAALEQDQEGIYDLEDEELPNHLREYRECVAWIEEEDDELHEASTIKSPGGTDLYIGPFTFNVVSSFLGAHCFKVRAAIKKLRTMPFCEIENAYSAYKNRKNDDKSEVVEVLEFKND